MCTEIEPRVEKVWWSSQALFANSSLYLRGQGANVPGLEALNQPSVLGWRCCWGASPSAAYQCQAPCLASPARLTRQRSIIDTQQGGQAGWRLLQAGAG